jgi:WD40 repeat protein
MRRSDGSIVQLFDPETGRPDWLALPTGHGAIFAVAAVPMASGRTLLVTGGDETVVQLWDAATRRPIRHRLRRVELHQSDAVADMVLMSLPGGPAMLAIATDDGWVRLWDPSTGQTIDTMPPAHFDEVAAIAAVPLPFRPVLAVACRDASVHIWDPAEDDRPRYTLRGHTDAVEAVVTVPGPDGELLIASAGSDTTLRRWSPVRGEPFGEPIETRHDGAVNAMTAVAVPDGRTLIATGGEDGTIRLWDPIDGVGCGQPITGHTDEIFALTAITTARVEHGVPGTDMSTWSG